MAQTVTSVLDAAMKVIFSDPLIVNIVQEAELLQYFRADGANIQTEETTGGRYIEMAHYFAYPAGVGAVAEGDYLPTPDDPSFKNSRVYLKKLMGVVEMTGDVMDRVVGDEGSFINYMERALPDLGTRVVNEIDRMYIGTGTGVKAVVAATAVGPIDTYYYDFEIKDALGISGYQQPWLMFLEGERVVFGTTATGGTIRTGGGYKSGKVVDIFEATNIIRVLIDGTLAAAVQVGDYIFNGDEIRNNAKGSATIERELQGLLAAVDDGNVIATYSSILRTATGNRLWKSIVKDASGAPYNGALTERLLDYMDTEVSIKGGGKTDLIVTSHSGISQYWDSLQKDRMFVDPRSYTGGKPTPLQVMLKDRVLPLRVARKMPAAVTFGVQRDTFRRLTLGDWKWDDRSGSIWNRVTDATGRKDAFYAVGYMREEFICVAPRKNWRIDGLSLWT